MQKKNASHFSLLKMIRFMCFTGIDCWYDNRIPDLYKLRLVFLKHQSARLDSFFLFLFSFISFLVFASTCILLILSCCINGKRIRKSLEKLLIDLTLVSLRQQ